MAPPGLTIRLWVPKTRVELIRFREPVRLCGSSRTVLPFVVDCFAALALIRRDLEVDTSCAWASAASPETWSTFSPQGKMWSQQALMNRKAFTDSG